MVDGPAKAGGLRAWLTVIGMVLVAGILGPLWWAATSPPVLDTVLPVAGDGVLLLPFAAVRNLRPELGHPGPPHVYVLADGRVHRTPVRLGRVNPVTVEIVGGIVATTVLIADPPHGLEDRHRVLARH